MTTVEFLEHLLENAKNDKPLKEGLLYQGKDPNSESLEGIHWNDLEQYSIKPYSVNGYIVPAPARYSLDVGTFYFTPELFSTKYYQEILWNNDEIDFLSLQRGLVFHSKEYAIAAAKAMLGINPDE